jgi:hypothetical protein
VVVAEPVTLAELIADCAELPAALRHPQRPRSPVAGAPRDAPPWQVDDECVSQVGELDGYGC